MLLGWCVTGVWILTAGLNSGVSKLIGRAVHRMKLLNMNLSKPTLIGMTTWGTLPDKLRDVIQTGVESILNMCCLISLNISFFSKGNRSLWSTEPMFKNKMGYSLAVDEREALDDHHTHFLLFDIGDPYKYLDDTPRSNFVQVAALRADSGHTQVRKKKDSYFHLNAEKVGNVQGLRNGNSHAVEELLTDL